MGVFVVEALARVIRFHELKHLFEQEDEVGALEELVPVYLRPNKWSELSILFVCGSSSRYWTGVSSGCQDGRATDLIKRGDGLEEENGFG